MHSLKLKKIKGVILKIDLSKYFDMVRWIYLRCNTPVLTPFALNAYDVNIIWNHGKELKAKVLSLINVWCICDHG